MNTKKIIIIAAISLTLLIGGIVYANKSKKDIIQVNEEYLEPKEVNEIINSVDDPEFVFFNVGDEFRITSLEQMKQSELKSIVDYANKLINKKQITSKETNSINALAKKYGIF